MALAMRTYRELNNATSVVALLRACYANRVSGELVWAHVSGIANPSDSNVIVVEDEYGGVFIVSADEFFERYSESQICPAH